MVGHADTRYCPSTSNYFFFWRQSPTGFFSLVEQLLWGKFFVNELKKPKPVHATGICELCLFNISNRSHPNRVTNFFSGFHFHDVINILGKCCPKIWNIWTPSTRSRTQYVVRYDSLSSVALSMLTTFDKPASQPAHRRRSELRRPK